MMRPDLLFEAVNGALFVIAAWAMVVFVKYIWRHRKEGYLFVAPAIFIGGVFAGETWLRSAFWWVRREINRGDTSIQVYPWWTISGTVFLMVMGALCIRTFDEEDSDGWIWALVAACIFVVASFTIPFDWPDKGY